MKILSSTYYIYEFPSLFHIYLSWIKMEYISRTKQWKGWERKKKVKVIFRRDCKNSGGGNESEKWRKWRKTKEKKTMKYNYEVTEERVKHAIEVCRSDGQVIRCFIQLYVTKSY